jgi:hypothetical protein
VRSLPFVLRHHLSQIMTRKLTLMVVSVAPKNVPPASLRFKKWSQKGHSNIREEALGCTKTLGGSTTQGSGASYRALCSLIARGQRRTIDPELALGAAQL